MCSFKDFPGRSAGKESARNAGDPSSIPGSGRSAGEEIGYEFQYSWFPLVAQTVKNLSAIQETWVGKIPWRKKQLPASVFWPGEFHEQRSLAGYSPWGHKESETIEHLTLSFLSRVSELLTHTQMKSNIICTWFFLYLLSQLYSQIFCRVPYSLF